MAAIRAGEIDRHAANLFASVGDATLLAIPIPPIKPTEPPANDLIAKDTCNELRYGGFIP
jgi:hypothetical protein